MGRGRLGAPPVPDAAENGDSFMRYKAPLFSSLLFFLTAHNPSGPTSPSFDTRMLWTWRRLDGPHNPPAQEVQNKLVAGSARTGRRQKRVQIPEPGNPADMEDPQVPFWRAPGPLAAAALRALLAFKWATRRPPRSKPLTSTLRNVQIVDEGAMSRPFLPSHLHLVPWLPSTAGGVHLQVTH